MNIPRTLSNNAPRGRIAVNLFEYKSEYYMKNMETNKLVIRRLPPSLTEEEFLKHVSPLPKHDYFCYFGPNPGLGQHSFSRAYINILNQEDSSVFRERFDNYVFLDDDGHEYPAVVEQTLWHKSAKTGPFCESNENLDSNQETPNSENQTIEEDPDFIEFTERLNSQKKFQNNRH